jgi:hypothetical protein
MAVSPGATAATTPGLIMRAIAGLSDVHVDVDVASAGVLGGHPYNPHDTCALHVLTRVSFGVHEMVTVIGPVR